MSLVFPSNPIGCWDYKGTLSSVCVCSGDPNPGPYDLVTGAFPTEPWLLRSLLESGAHQSASQAVTKLQESIPLCFPSAVFTGGHHCTQLLSWVLGIPVLILANTNWASSLAL